MFQRRRSSDRSPIDPTNPKTTTLATDLVIEGRLRTPGDAIIYGTLQGDLEVGGRLRMLPGSRVQGTVLAAEARLEGTVEGPVTVTGKLEVARTARVEGDLQAGTLAMAEGAVLLGTMRIAGELVRCSSAAAGDCGAARSAAHDVEPAVSSSRAAACWVG